MKKHLLLVNENGSDNIGDHAINAGLQALLENKTSHSFKSVPFSAKTSRAGDAKQVDNAAKGFLYKIKRIIYSYKPLFHLLWFLKNKSKVKTLLNGSYDGVVIGGGQLILSGSTFPIAMYTWVRYAKRLNLPVYLIGVGCGERFLRSEITLYKLALHRCDKVLVRELDSIAKLKRFFGVDSEFVSDLAFGLMPLAKTGPGSGIVVGMTDYAVYQRYRSEVTGPDCTDYDTYLNVWCEKAVGLLNNEDEPIYLASTTYRDALCNRELFALLKGRVKNPVMLIDGVLPLDEYRRLLSSARLVFSGRMHSLILGKVEGCAIEPWVISAKISGFLNDYEERSCDDIVADLIQGVAFL